MKLQRLYSYTRQAIDMYNMINDDDRIAIGVSGGKDSLTLLYALSGLRKFYPVNYNLEAILVDLGSKNMNYVYINNLCKQLDVKLHVVETKISSIVFDERKESNPCSLCSKLRKGALNEKALELGCSKVAYAHHKDDFIETMMLSLMYEGRFSTFLPVTNWDKTGLTLIRPLMLISESEIIGFSNKYDLPIIKNPCIADGNTKRGYVKNLLRQINLDNPGVKNRLFTAILNGNIEGWPNQITL